jgi:predicted AAA+ superfamily ATPase
VLLLGPRQVGKSTLCRSLGLDLSINLANESTYVRHAKDPGLLEREVAALKRSSLILVDEIQRIPSLLNTIQFLIDEGRGHRFLLTGSSARKLKRGGANLLPGRIIMETLDPLSYWEMKGHFSLDRALRLGTLPGIYADQAEGESVLSAYAGVYLREEIQAETAVRNISGYARFLDTAAQASGQWINYSKIASDAEIPKETVRRFYKTLEETLMVFRIPPFQSNSPRRLAQRDRYVFFDIGVRNAILGLHQGSPGATEEGRLFEQWVLLQCLYFSRALQKSWKIFSYRTDTGLEVDFVIDRGNNYLAVECKRAKRAEEQDLNGLRSFAALSGKPTTKILVYQGAEEQKFPRGERVLPYGLFLDELAAGRL